MAGKQVATRPRTPARPPGQAVQGRVVRSPARPAPPPPRRPTVTARVVTTATPQGKAAKVAAAAASKRKPAPAQAPAAEPGRGYHGIILAEYLAVMVTLFATEILGGKGGTAGEQDVTAATRSYSGIAVRMTAASVLFFVLALASSGGRAGKAAAALGGLVTLGAVMNAAPVWTKAAGVFAGGAGKSQGGDNGGVGGGEGGGGGGGSF